MSAPGASWQKAELVASFADRRRILVPLIDLQEDVVKQLLCRHDRAVARFLDLGAGAGAMSDLVLTSQPDSEGVLVDFSEPMLERAHANLAGYPGRWQLVNGDLSKPNWRAKLPAGSYDAVVSGLAIHHLPSERKRALFAETFALLEPGGIFVNMDYVTIDGPLRGLFDEQMLANAVRAERESGGSRSEQEVDCEDDDDLPDSAEDQVRWLRDVGFEQAEVHFKWAEAAVFGAIKPS
ncbi:MAG TPA: class I SAM-dependent methyltransferase [Solirubrobacteraceae bacterium]